MAKPKPLFSDLNAPRQATTDLIPEATRIQASTDRVAKELDRPGTLEVAYEALRDSRVMSWGLVDRFFASTSDEDRASIDRGYNYAAVQDEVEAGLSWEEVQYLRENGVRGAGSLREAQLRNAMRRDTDAVYAQASGPAQFFGQMLAGMADPTALMVGLGVTAAAARTAVGAGRLVQQGRPWAAVGAVVGENVAGELAFTALQDASGEVLGVADYTMAAAGAAVLGVAFSRGTYKTAAENFTVSEARRIAQDAQRIEVDAMTRDNVDPTDPQAVAQWRQDQATTIVAEPRTLTDTPVIPDDIRQDIVDEAEGKVKEEIDPDTGRPVVDAGDTVIDPEADPTTVEPLPEVDTQYTPDDALRVADELVAIGDPAQARALLIQFADNSGFSPDELSKVLARIDSLDPTTKVTEQGNRITLLADENATAIEMQFGASPIREKMEATTGVGGKTRPYLEVDSKTALETLVASKPQQRNPALIRIARQLLDNYGDLLTARVYFANVDRGWSGWTNQILNPVKKVPDAKNPTGGPQRITDKSTPASVIDKLGDWAAKTVVHEIVHSLTQRVTALASDASKRRRLSRPVLEAIETLEDVLQRLHDSIPEHQRGQQQGKYYAAKNVDELVAQAFSDAETQRALAELPASPKWGGRWGNALQELVAAVKQILGGVAKDRSALDDVYNAVDVIIQAQRTAKILVPDMSGGFSSPRLTGEVPATRQPLWDSWSFVAKHRQSVDANPANQKLVDDLTRGQMTTTQQVGLLEQGTSFYGEFATGRRWQPVREALQQLQAKYLPDSHIVLSDVLDSTKADRPVNGQILTVGDNHIIGLNLRRLGNPEQVIRTLVHEVGHAVFHTHARNVPPEMLARMKDDFAAFLAQVYANNPEAVNARFSITSMNRQVLKDKALKSNDYNTSFDEYTAEQFVKFVETRTAMKQEGGLVGDAKDYLTALLKSMIAFFRGSKNAGMLRPSEEFADFFQGVLTAAERRGAEEAQALSGPINPVATVGARKKFAERMYAHATAFLAQNPIDHARLRVITAKFGGLSDGLRLASSNNPILQMVASMVTETTTGAAGRRANVALRKETLKMKLLGNSRLDFENAYSAWKTANKVRPYDDLVSGEARRKFDRKVYEEILARRQSGVPITSDAAVRKAADAMQALYERSLKAQKDASVLGADRLPATSVGYIPQALDGRKLAEATPQELAELSEHLALHWEAALQWDARFSRQFAEYYINRARARTMDPSSKDFSGSSSDGVDIVREGLTEMATQVRDPSLAREAAKAKRGLGQTKKRLDVDLLGTLPSGKKVLDFYEDDTMALAMRYINRTSGNVALTEFGIPGTDGVKHLRDAATMYAENKADTPTQEELEAFDRVMAEIMGRPVPGQYVSHRAAGIRMFVMLQRLGSMVYTQAAETVNMVHHLGISASLRGIASLPKMMGEVGRVKRGQAAGNHILTSIEQWGGEFGAANYKMVFPLDPPDNRLETYVDDPGLLHRMLTAGAYYQSKVTGFRALMAAQHRMVAEQIVMKAAKYLRDGGQSDRWLADMGIDEELAGHFRAHLTNVAKWDAQGNLVAFDITQVSNPRAAEAMVQAVHRGVNQIIQGTFIGERNAWAHNDWIKVLTQLRTFGLTSTEKQWARVREVTGGGGQGYVAAAALLVGQMAMVLPIIVARVHMASVGREDQEEFIEKNLQPGALVRSAMNYTALSGMFGDVLDLLGGLSGQFLSDEQKELVGGRQGQSAGKVSDAVPAIGSLDAAGRVLTGNSTVYNALKQLPFSNTPYLIPIINLFKE